MRWLARAALILGCAISIFSPASALGATGDITTVAGNGFSGYSGDGGPAISASLSAPAGVAFTGGDLFVADFFTHTVRRVSSGGTIDAVAGTGTAGYSGDGGVATSAQLNQPGDAITDAAGNVYIADFVNSRVRRVNPLGTISTFAGTGSFGHTGDGGPATAARLGNPAGLEMDSAGNVYVTDFGTHVVRRITPAGIISTVAGNGSAGYSGDGGPATSARLDQPGDVAVDGAGNLFIGEFSGHRVRKVSTGGTISTIGGTGSPGYSGTGGPATSAQMSSPAGVDVDSSGNVFVAEYGNHVIRKIDTSGTITRVAGTGLGGFSGDGGPAVSAQLQTPSRVSLSPDGDFYISDWGNHRVRHVEGLGSPDAPTFSSTSPASPSASNTPRVIGGAPSGSTVRLYTNATCTSAVAAVGTAAQLASPGLQVTVPSDSTTTFWGTATDAGGNPSGCSTASITYIEDSTPPSAPSIDSAPPSPGNDATPTWAFSAAGAASYECRLMRGATIVSGWAACASPRTYDLSSQADGTYSFSARAIDAAGNTGPVAASTYDLDTAAPAAPSIASAPPSPGNYPLPDWSFSGEAGAAFECRLVRGATVVSDWAACTSPRSFDLSAEPDGSHAFSVRASDAAGNTSPDAISTYVLDRSAPAAPSIGSAPASPGNDSTPSWGFSGEGGASFECRLMRGATVVSDWAACTSPRSFDLLAEPDGSYAFSVRARDAAGNTSSAASSSYQLDTASPAMPSIDSVPATPGTDSTPSWSFSGDAGAGFECRLVRGATVVSDWAACADPKTYDLSSEADGGYTFSVRARDAAGNAGASNSSAYDLDRAAPAAPSVDLAPTSPGNGRSPVWGFSGEAGAAFECRLARGATVISDWAACSSPRTYSLLLEPDGTYTLSVRATDAVGNTGAAASSDYALDTSSPATPTIDSAPPSPGNDRSPAWSFSGDAGASVECRLVRGATVVSDWAACADPKTYDLSAEPEGSYVFSARASDAAGNTSPDVSSAYMLDTNAPATPSIDSSPSSPGNDSSPAWSFSGEAGAAFECRLARGATVVSDWTACSDPKAYDLSAGPDAGYTFSVRASDAAGNTGPPASSAYDLDTTAPGTPTIDWSPPSPSNDRAPAWGFSGEAGASLECRLVRGATVVSDWASCSSPQAYDLGSEPDGDYQFGVRASDAAGNASATASSDYTLDAAIPSVPSIDSTPGVVGNSPSPAWGFSGDANASFECRMERAATVIFDWAACSSPQSFDLTNEPDGDYDFLVRAVRAGERSAPASGSYALDRSAPAAPSIDSTPASPAADRSPSWSFAGEAGGSFECRVTSGATVVSDWAACSSPATADLSAQPDGTYTFAARVTDAAGNTGPASSSDYDLDTSAPVAPSIDSSPPSPGSAVDPAWSFSGEAGASFECRLTRGGATVSPWAACSSPRAHDLSSQPDGTYTFAVRASDVAGNTGAAAGSDYTLDRTGAAVRIESGPGAAGTDRRPEWAFSAEAGAGFECRVVRGGSVISAWAACSSPKAVDLSSEPEGNYTFSVRATDSLGNQGAPADADYELDTTAPAAPVIGAEPASPSRDTTPAWAFSAEPGASLECHLEGAGRLLANWTPCSSPRSFNVAGGADGRYALSVRATDRAGNMSAPASSDFELDTTAPNPPEITSSPGRFGGDVTPTWKFTGERGATFECSLRRGTTMVAGADACASPREYDLGPRPEGDYTISLRARDAAGNLSVARTDGYELRAELRGEDGSDGEREVAAGPPRQPDTEAPGPTADTPGGGLEPNGTPAGDDERGRPSPAGDAHGGTVGEGIAGKLATPESAAPSADGDSGSPVLNALGKAAKAVARHADKSVFPGILILMVLSFFGVQNRIDRNDPKLGLAPVFADPDLTFDPPLPKP